MLGLKLWSIPCFASSSIFSMIFIMIKVEHISLSYFSYKSMNSLNVIWALYLDDFSLFFDEELFLEEISSYLLLTLLGLTYFLSMADWYVSTSVYLVFTGEYVSLILPSLSTISLVYLIADVTTDPVNALVLIILNFYCWKISAYFLVVYSSISNLLILSLYSLSYFVLSSFGGSYFLLTEEILILSNYRSCTSLSCFILRS